MKSIPPRIQKRQVSPQAKYALLLIALVSSTLTYAASVGDPAPFFELEGRADSTYRIDDFKNKVVFVNFWASWCAPCRKELPLLDQLQSKHHDLVVLAINIDSEKVIAEQFLEKYKIKSLVLFDPDTEVVASYGAIAMPTSFILDKKGIIRYSHYGFNAKSDPEKWDAEVNSLLGVNQ